MAWINRTIVTPTEPVGVGEFGGSTVVGTQPPSAWGDNSDATYVYAEQQWGTLVDNIAPQITGQLNPEPDLYVAPGVRCAVWVRMEGTSPVPIRVRLTGSPGADYRIWNEEGTSNGLTAPDGWTVIELLDGFWSVEETLTSWREGSPLWLTFQANAPVPDPDGSFTAHTYIYEARVVTYSERFGAPACRKFPREDGLGAGSGRHFPPAKSQQRSGRRFGYY